MAFENKSNPEVAVTTNDDNIYVEVIRGNYGIQNFSTEVSGYGNLKRLSVDLINYHNNTKERVVSTKISTFRNKLNKKVQKWEKEYRKRFGKQKAKEITEKANQNIEYLNNILEYTIQEDKEFSLDRLKSNESFKEQKPSEPKYEEKAESPHKPKKSNFNLKLTLFDKLFPSRRQEKIKEFKQDYKQSLKDWDETVKKVKRENSKIEKENERKKEKWLDSVEEWKSNKLEFESQQQKQNSKYDTIDEKFRNGNDKYIEKYYSLLIDNLDYIFPEQLLGKNAVEFRDGILVINYFLPSVDHIPTLEKVKYIISRQELKEKHLSKTKVKKLYDRVLYGLTLAIIYIVFEEDDSELIEAVSLNGMVADRNKKTGKKEKKCVLSLQAEKEQFHELDLKHVDPKECFKGLKGISASKLINMTPVQPIIEMNREDGRFIENQDILSDVDESNNLAVMDWQEFEHLIRDIFEREFSEGDGEVNVTQSSRDQGVDAIAYDPDPIKGGKIVLQAKRYTNTVGVSHVRDLYGTVINEGANRGILITTSSFGSESHKFAKDKPIKLLNGQELLYLLKKHGYSARIDIDEARKIMNEGDG